MKNLLWLILLTTLGCEDTQLIRLECVPNTTRECHWEENSTQIALGECSMGVEVCTSAGWSECRGAQGPEEETCDGVDNNCNGVVDETYPEENQLCGMLPDVSYGTGICSPGTFICERGTLFCADHTGPEEEICDNLDNDCNGVVDDNIPNQTATVCYDGDNSTLHVGQCRAGVQYCSAGGYGPCEGQVLPEAERCDNIDNDCDGEIDEGLEERAVDIVFILDISGSFDEEINSMINGIEPLLTDSLTSRFRFGLVVIGSRDQMDHDLMGSPYKGMRIITDFVPADEFLDFLLTVRDLPSAGREPSYDALTYIMDGTFGMTFGETTQKVVIIMTDEEGQSLTIPHHSQTSCRRLVQDLGYEVFIFALQEHYPSFSVIINNDATHYFSPSADAQTVFQQIKSIFDGLCVGGG